MGNVPIYGVSAVYYGPYQSERECNCKSPCLHDYNYVNKLCLHSQL